MTSRRKMALLGLLSTLAMFGGVAWGSVPHP